MGLRTKFNLALLAAIAIGMLVGAVAFRYVSVKNARAQILENASIMMTAANAIRTYTARDLVPLLPREHDGKFVPETVPAYAAQKNFKEVQAALAGFSYREPALNPTNLSNRAQDWEADIINLFRNDPSRREVVTERDTPVGPTLKSGAASGDPVGGMPHLPQHTLGGAGGLDPDLWHRERLWLATE